MLNSLLPMSAANVQHLEDFRQIAIFIYHIKYNEILYSLWNAYFKSGLGELQSTEEYHLKSSPILNTQLWPIQIKSKVKKNIRLGINEHDSCLTYVKNRLVELEKIIKQFQTNLYDQFNRLYNHAYSLSMIREKIEIFIEDKLIDLRKKIQYKIQLIYYDYDERIFELQYLRCDPTENQVT